MVTYDNQFRFNQYLNISMRKWKRCLKKLLTPINYIYYSHISKATQGGKR